MPKMTVPQLCKLLPGPVGIDAHVELVRRQAFSTADLAIIPGGRIELGMSEGAMFCALGAPERSNRSVGSWGVHIQHVYPGVIVYTENGKVTAFQD